MTDDDLVKQLVDWSEYDEGKINDTRLKAANRIEALQAERDELRMKLAMALEHLEWFISEDETNRGDTPMPEYRDRTWNEINAYWLSHLDSAIAFVEELKGAKE